MFTQLLTLALVFGSLTVQAQQDWVWDAYDVSIELPDDFKVIKNSNNEFEAEGEGMEIFMFIFDLYNELYFLILGIQMFIIFLT